MEHEIIVAKFDSKIIFKININDKNYISVVQQLERERQKFLIKLKDWKSAGVIKNISYPRNKILQPEIDNLVKRKKIILDAIYKIKRLFRS